MKTTKITYELPKVLPHGWKGEMARLLGIHRNTVANAIKRGEKDPKDPLYIQIMQMAKNKYGKPIKVEEVA